MSVIAINHTKATTAHCRVLPFTLLLILLTSLVAYAAVGDQHMPQHDAYQRLAILPWHMNTIALKFKENINDAMKLAMEDTKVFHQHYSYYSQESEKQPYTQIINSHAKKIWKKKGFFSKKQPQKNIVLDIGKKIHTDAIIMYDAYLEEEDLDTIVVYLFAIQTGKQYSAKGYTDYFGQEGFQKVYDLTQDVMLQYKTDHPPGILLVQRQNPASEGKTNVLAQQQPTEAKRRQQQDAERKRLEEAAQLAAQKRLEEQRQREQSARVAALQRQQQEEQRRLQEAEKQQQEAEHTRLKEVARLAAQKRLEEQRQREQAARVAALLKRQEERQRREEAQWLAAQQRHKARDTTPPTITLSSHNAIQPTKVSTTTSRVLIVGKVQDTTGVAEVLVNGSVAPLDREGNFSHEVLLRVGDNQVKVSAIDVHANAADVQFAIEREAAVVVHQSAALIRQKYNIGKYYAMVIGNNEYRHLPKLATAVNDAQKIGKVLREQYGFETAVLLNATRGDILSTLSSFRRKMNPQDNFLVYYAGHGVFERVAQEAYWLPIDAQEDDFANWIISDSITSEIKRNPANHIMIVADSCYSGTLTRAADVNLGTKQKREYFLQKMLGKPSRTLMASGGNEPVADGGAEGHSIFAYTFLRALSQMDQVAFTAEELFYRFVKQSVAGNAEQTPEYSIIRNSGHDGGDFVFVKK